MPIEKILALHNIIILIKSVVNKDKSHCYYKIFFKKRLYQLAKKQWQFFYSKITLIFGERKIATKKFHGAKKNIKIWDFNANKKVIAKINWSKN